MDNQEPIRDARTLGVPKMLILGLQHMFAMFGATVLVPIRRPGCFPALPIVQLPLRAHLIRQGRRLQDHLTPSATRPIASILLRRLGRLQLA